MISLDVEHLLKIYPSVVAVDDLSFSVGPGEVVGIVGPNGAGKSTLIKCLTGMEYPDKGRVSIFGHDLFTKPEMAKRHIAYVPETPEFIPTLTVQEHINFVASAYWAENYQHEMDRLLEAFDLYDKRHDTQHSLSKGQIQKTLIISAFIHNPKLMFFDEPLLGIDPKGGKLLKDMIREKRSEGGSVLISSHMLDLIEEVSDRVIILHEGKIIASGSFDELEEKMAMPGSDFTDVFIKITEE